MTLFWSGGMMEGSDFVVVAVVVAQLVKTSF
jgi:hypothetical protein